MSAVQRLVASRSRLAAASLLRLPLPLRQISISSSSSLASRISQCPTPPPLVTRCNALSPRFFSSATSKPWQDRNEIVEFDELQQLIQGKDKTPFTLIDVRTPEEAAEGVIPKANVVPVQDLDLALRLKPESFEKLYKFPLPGLDDNIVFYCRSGKRSTVATELARKLGYTRVRNYVGSWLEWSDKMKGTV
ncbi:hypothetical protein HDV05_002033 [Chytridiales sp. JEL 0842]|nr:hypothetical protein HDV05_002033 [Chytridiales sp. JEL 0842]